MLQVRLNAPSFANVAPPPVALNVNASSNPAYSQRLSTDTLQRSGTAVQTAEQIFEKALYATKHKPGSLGYLVKTEHELRAKQQELSDLQQLVETNQTSGKTGQLFIDSIQKLIGDAQLQIKTIENEKDGGLFNFGRDLHRFKTGEGDIDLAHLAKHKDFETKMAFRADGNYPENHRQETVLPAQAFWRELGNHYLEKALKTHDVGMLERFDYRDDDPTLKLKPFGGG